MLGALRGDDSGGELEEEVLFEDQLSIVVRAVERFFTWQESLRRS